MDRLVPNKSRLSLYPTATPPGISATTISGLSMPAGVHTTFTMVLSFIFPRTNSDSSFSQSQHQLHRTIIWSHFPGSSCRNPRIPSFSYPSLFAAFRRIDGAVVASKWNVNCFIVDQGLYHCDGVSWGLYGVTCSLIRVKRPIMKTVDPVSHAIRAWKLCHGKETYCFKSA